ncbi:MULTISPECIES: hypothetical protein [Sinorhizobium]|uniref:hypothetical protein n=1 Tax=Sinorhizobium TaxID=28105 RepID=UPI000D48692B|nr:MULTISPECIES: hypothetical protein [Sinorhizobium]POH31752.1 hypothetical protein ATY30_09940 [Sinorhizobium americanum]
MSFPWSRFLGGMLVLAALFWAVLEIRENGAQAVRNSIERQNNEAANSADAKRLDYDACSHSGGLWNFGAGKCERPARRGRH